MSGRPSSGEFGVPDEDVLYVQYRVYREMAIWTALVGVVLIAMPVRRFGNAYQFITEIPCGTTVLGAIYLTCATIMGTSMRRKSIRGMAFSLLSGGIINWMLGIFLLAGAIAGPTGVLGAPFCLYVGRHMFIHSALFTAQYRRGRKK